ncbi:glycerol-3-phosphate 1-O-acyltransferase PlsY [Pontibacterium sp.]|uniref:glycerol-3-phosphate 1-O-acyltransferase PlsY n=1 Tax=Pontibacterium sp. TaxID=2036026 RepID=UPI00351503BF
MPELELLNALMVATAYLLGSVPSAILVCHCMGIADPRQQGSRNPGASNVLRIGNRKAAFFTLIGDIGKGWCAVSLPQWMDLESNVANWCALAVVLGHLFPLFARFSGGKGVATAVGVCLALSIPLGIIQMVLWGMLISIGRIASLASIGCALISPLAAWLVQPGLMMPVLLISVLLLYTHRENIKRLIKGAESRF